MNFQFHKFPLISLCFDCPISSLFLSHSPNFIFPYHQNIASPSKRPLLPPFFSQPIFMPNKQLQRPPFQFFFLLWIVCGSFFDLFSSKAQLSINLQLKGFGKGIEFWNENFTFQCRYPMVFQVSFRSEITLKLPPTHLERLKT